jgi:hypothetical protein
MDAELCPICHESILKENGKIVTSCNHEFHITCMTKWMQNDDATCPVCRSAPKSTEVYLHTLQNEVEEEEQEEEVSKQCRLLTYYLSPTNATLSTPGFFP